MDERYLDLVMEECAEVIQCCTKIKRFGANDKYPGYYNGVKNIVALKIEIGDLLSTIAHLGIDIRSDIIQESLRSKTHKLKTYGPDGTYLAEKRKRDKRNARRRAVDEKGRAA